MEKEFILFILRWFFSFSYYYYFVIYNKEYNIFIINYKEGEKKERKVNIINKAILYIHMIPESIIIFIIFIRVLSFINIKYSLMCVFLFRFFP